MYCRNDEINAYLNARGKVILNACPGGGKTTSIAYKLQVLTKEIVDSFNNYSGVACLSFTNIAKDEINEKFKSFSGNSIAFPHIVSTIDSFINQFVVLPHYHLLFPEVKRPTILDNPTVLDTFELKFLFKFKLGNSPIRFKYLPSTIHISQSNKFLSNGFSPNLNSSDLLVFNNYCKSLKKWQFKIGLLTNDDASFIANQLLNNFPQIGINLIKRFPYIILDEAQDTSEIHYTIFDKLIELGLNQIEIIGDPFQSLYEWREARPDLFMQKYNDTINWKSFDFTNCRRSSQNIIDTYSILRNDNKNIQSVDIENNNNVFVIKYQIGSELKAIEEYLKLAKDYTENHIVVRGRTMLNNLLGYGSNNNSFWKTEIPNLLIHSKQLFLKNEIKDAVNKVRKVIPILINPEMDYKEKRELEIELKNDYKINSQLINLLLELPSFELTLREWTNKTEIYLKTFFELDEKPDFQLKQKQGKTYEISITSLFNISETTQKLPISTIHQVKGKTFESLLLFLSENSQGQNISIKDITKPNGLPNEKQRMIYVAMSRPKYLLALAIPDNYDNEMIKKVLSDKIEIK